jgi:hypothetical protein
MSLLAQFGMGQCNYDSGTIIRDTGGFPYLFGGTSYTCDVKGVIDYWGTSDLGFSGLCDSSGTSLGLIGSVSKAGDALTSENFYSEIEYGI